MIQRRRTPEAEAVGHHASAAGAASQFPYGVKFGIGISPAKDRINITAPMPNMATTRFLLPLSLEMKELRMCAPPRRVAAPHGTSHRTRRCRATSKKKMV